VETMQYLKNKTCKEDSWMKSKNLSCIPVDYRHENLCSENILNILHFRDNNTTLDSCAPLQIIICKQASFSCCIPNDESSFFGTLYIGLVVAPNPITNSDEGESFLVEHVSVTRCKFNEPFSKLIVVLFLLSCIVQR